MEFFMVKVISVNDLWFRGRPVILDGGCDGIPCSDLDKLRVEEPTDNELFEIEIRERKERKARAEGNKETIQAAFQSSIISTTFKIK